MPFGIGLPELLVILGICALIFGPSALPKFGKGLGEGIREFKKVGKELSSLHEDETEKYG